MTTYSTLTEAEVIAAARRALDRREVELEVHSDTEIIRLEDPDASGVAVQVWVYLMDDPKDAAAHAEP